MIYPLTAADAETVADVIEEFLEGFDGGLFAITDLSLDAGPEDTWFATYSGDIQEVSDDYRVALTISLLKRGDSEPTTLTISSPRIGVMSLDNPFVAKVEIQHGVMTIAQQPLNKIAHTIWQFRPVE